MDAAVAAGIPTSGPSLKDIGIMPGAKVENVEALVDTVVTYSYE